MPLRPTRKAFSLIEAAIVLGVVGLIIGGIWIAAAAVQKSLGRTELVKISTTIIGELRSDFRDTPPPTTTSYNLISYIQKKGLFNWPYQVAAQPWIGLVTPNGITFDLYYTAPGGNPSYPYSEGRFGLSLGSWAGPMTTSECYHYLTLFQEYYAVMDGHGDIVLKSDLDKIVALPSGRYRDRICAWNLSNGIVLYFDR